VIASTSLRGVAATATDGSLPLADLDHVLDVARDDLLRWRGARLLLTGATGFVGSWLADTLLHANRRLALGANVSLLVRDLDRLPARVGGDPFVSPLVGDVRTFHAPGLFDGVIHAAASSSAAYGTGDGAPWTMAQTIVGGTTRMLEVAGSSGRIPFLFVSSGAVYGLPGPSHAPVAEDTPAALDPTDPRAAYAESKRMAENLCAISAGTGGPACTIARGFAFVGPRLPLDAHFAAGNFVGDALAGRPVAVHSDGTAVRSYLYAADLAIWLWRVLAQGAPGRAYNVGSERAVSIAQLANCVAATVRPGHPVVIDRQPTPGAERNAYVPSTARARAELGLEETVPLDDALARTIAWHRGVGA
jgi:dTDP-glucose 4,6-dehydratase